MQRKYQKRLYMKGMNEVQTSSAALHIKPTPNLQLFKLKTTILQHIEHYLSMIMHQLRECSSISFQTSIEFKIENEKVLTLYKSQIYCYSSKVTICHLMTIIMIVPGTISTSDLHWVLDFTFLIQK